MMIDRPLVWASALAMFFAFSFPASGWAGEEGWRAGVASVVITPEESMSMAGYAARTEPSDGKVHDLHAKALSLQAAGGERLVIVTCDLVGIPRELRDWLETEVDRRFDLPPRSLLINASHTHCGPELRVRKASIYGISPQRVKQSARYVEVLKEKLVDVIERALDGAEPATLGYTHARAGFAMNRRLETENGFANRPNPDGPVDHSVPVLRVDSPDGPLRAIVFGYACHNTTLGFQKFCGDYAGFAQQYLEAAHPEATALFVTGCGGDQNPQPRRTLALAEQHGRTLANAVEAALISPAVRLEPTLRTALGEATLEFADSPSQSELEQQLDSRNKYERRHARLLLDELEENGSVRTTYPYLVQAVRFGDQLTLIALAGEVVVDYSLRLQLELPETAVWVAGYSNDVFGYLPSLRVLQEGGYEGGGAMRYSRLPGPFSPSVERRVIAQVHELVERIGEHAAQP